MVESILVSIINPSVPMWELLREIFDSSAHIVDVAQPAGPNTLEIKFNEGKKALVIASIGKIQAIAVANAKQ